MLKRTLSILLVLVLVLGMAPQYAAAAAGEEGSLDNFSSDLVYTGFADVKESDWYYASIKQAYELGLMNGSGDGFDPKGSITLAQTIVLAARVHSIYHTGKADFKNSNPWYQVYVDYCLENGVLEAPCANYNAKASRAEFALILAHALPEEELDVLNEVADGGIPDVTMTRYGAEEIYTLYRAGIIGGSDGLFLPDNSITRAEASTIIARMAKPEQRLGYIAGEKPDEEDEPSLPAAPGLANFKKLYSYTGFSDVKSSAWYFDSVKNAFEYGLVNGSGGLFKPSDNIKLSETLTIACRLHEIYNGGDGVIEGSSSPWYQTYVDYAVKNGIIEDGKYKNYNAYATRAQFATILAACFPEAALPIINNVSAESIPDVKGSESYGKAVYMLYRAGILTGSDEAKFYPRNNILRSEVAAIVTRMADTSLRKLFTLGDGSGPAPANKMDEFYAKTIHDFPAELVLNFDEDESNNFGVLNESVLRLEDVTAEKNGDGSYTFSDAEAVEDLLPGTAVLVKSAEGEIYLFTVGAIEDDVVTPAEGDYLKDYYQYLKVDFDTWLDASSLSKTEPGTAGSGSDNSFEIGEIEDKGFYFKGTLESDNLDLELTGAAIVTGSAEVYYDVELFGEDYIYFDLNTIPSFTATATVTAKVETDLLSLNKDIELGEFPLYCIVPGLNLTAELNLPVSISAETELTGTLTIIQSHNIHYENGYDEPVHTITPGKSEADVECEGEISLSVGIGIELGADFMDDLLELVLDMSLSGGMRGSPEKPDKSTKKKPDSIHMCDLCIDGEIYGELKGELKFTVNVSENTQLDLITLPIAEYEFEIDAFYVSLKNPADSPLEGKLKCGMGACINNAWRVDWELEDKDGKPVSTEYDVYCVCTDSEKQISSKSSELVYLYDGFYKANVISDDENFEPEIETFSIDGEPQSVTLLAPSDDLRDVYTKYLLDTGYKSMFKNGKPKYADIQTNYGDFDGNGIEDLLIYYANTQYSGPRGYETYTVLYTIDEKSGEVVEVCRYYYGGGTMGGDYLTLRYCTVTDSFKLVIDSTMRDGIYKATVADIVLNYAGTLTQEGDRFAVDSIYLGDPNGWYADQIADAKRGPYEIDGDYIRVYSLNDKAISKSAYEMAYYLEKLPEDSEFATYKGTYYEPIRPAEEN